MISLCGGEAFSSDHKAEKHTVHIALFVRVIKTVLRVVRKIEPLSIQASSFAVFFVQSNFTCGNHNRICLTSSMKPK